MQSKVLCAFPFQVKNCIRKLNASVALYVRSLCTYTANDFVDLCVKYVFSLITKRLFIQLSFNSGWLFWSYILLSRILFCVRSGALKNCSHKWHGWNHVFETRARARPLANQIRKHFDCGKIVKESTSMLI